MYSIVYYNIISVSHISLVIDGDNISTNQYICIVISDNFQVSNRLFPVRFGYFVRFTTVRLLENDFFFLLVLVKVTTSCPTTNTLQPEPQIKKCLKKNIETISFCSLLQTYIRSILDGTIWIRPTGWTLGVFLLLWRMILLIICILNLTLQYYIIVQYIL